MRRRSKVRWCSCVAPPLRLAIVLIAMLMLAACQIKPAGSTPMPMQTTTCIPIPTPTTQTPEIELPFETIAKSIHSSYEGYDPRMIIVFDPLLVPHLPTLPEEVRQALQAVDYHTELVIAVYIGFGGWCSSALGISRITYDGTATVHVEATLRTLAINDLQCSPYHIVRLKKPEAIGDRQVRFVLVEKGEELIKQQHKITPLQ